MKKYLNVSRAAMPRRSIVALGVAALLAGTLAGCGGELAAITKKGQYTNL